MSVGNEHPRHPTRTARVALAAAVTVLVASGTAACTTPRATPAPRTTTSAADLAAVRVAGDPGRKPVVTMPAPFSVPQTQRRVVVQGDGASVRKGQRVTVDYLGINGTDGQEFTSSFGARPSSFVLDPEQDLLPGLVTALLGSTVGSRIVVAIPPKDGYGVEGAPSAGIGPTDTLVVVVDVRAAKSVLERASGRTVRPKPGLPVVRVPSGGSPRISLPPGKPPSVLVVQPLIVGAGPKVKKGQQITVHYSGVIWPGGRTFDSSWQRKAPATFPIGRGQVVAGWDAGLVGQTVGSRILLVIPPDKGYGAAGRPSAGITGTDTLVFVVDILDSA